jgi:hypothetical protein
MSIQAAQAASPTVHGFGGISPDPKIATVTAPTKQVNATRPHPARTARSTAHEQPYVVIPGGGQQSQPSKRSRAIAGGLT